MKDPYSIKIFVPDGNPEGSKVINLLNWTGVGIAFPRLDFEKISKREEFSNAGVYILVGTAEGTDDELPTVYIGQGEEDTRPHLQSRLGCS